MCIGSCLKLLFIKISLARIRKSGVKSSSKKKRLGREALCFHGDPNGIRTRIIPHGMRDVLTLSKEKRLNCEAQVFIGDPNGIRTRITGVRGRRPNR